VSAMKVSLVVPCFNEAENVPRLVAEIDEVVAAHGLDAEVILVDDGSRDGTAELLVAQAEKDARYKAVIFRRNFGQTAAMVAGIDHASGEVIIPLDADLQNDPKDIPRLLAEIDKGFDVVSGWRKNRQDKLLSRRFPSVIANRLIARVGGVHIHDYGCTLKAYRRSVIEHVQLYGEMHRFIPIYASWAGGKVTEIVVNHRPRTAGQSKYGIGRTFKVILDLLTVKLLGSYATKPIYFFGFFGFALMASGVLIAAAVALLKLLQVLGEIGYWQHTFSLGLLGAFLFLVGTQSVMMGLLAELQVRTYHESQHKPIYLVKQTVNVDKQRVPRAPQVERKSA
jgi:glycosyltransferase involved in cell wall biosynthesis